MSVLRLALLILTLLTATNGVAAQDFCPATNPADVEAPKVINEREKRKWVLCKCGQEANGQYTLTDGKSVEAYIVLIHNNFLARYDTNCNLIFDAEEKAKYRADQEELGTKMFAKAVADTAKETAYEQTQFNRRIEKRKQSISQEVAISILPDTDAQKREFVLGLSFADTAVESTDQFNIGYKFAETPWLSPTTNSKISFGLELAASLKEIDTSTNNTTTRSIDFFPLSYSLTPLEDLTFTASLGAAYLFTDDLVNSTGIETKEKDVAFVYKLGTKYQTALPCLSFGIDYKIRTGKFTKDKLSHEWTPNLTFDLTKPCKTQ